MPIYEYHCTSCKADFEVAKSMSEFDSPETCKCGSPETVKRISRFNFNGASDWNTQGFNPGLGVYTKNNAHARKIAKERGLEEVGNERPDKIAKHYERMREQKAHDRYEDALRVKQFDD